MAAVTSPVNARSRHTTNAALDARGLRHAGPADDCYRFPACRQQHGSRQHGNHGFRFSGTVTVNVRAPGPCVKKPSRLPALPFGGSRGGDSRSNFAVSS